MTASTEIFLILVLCNIHFASRYTRMYTYATAVFYITVRFGQGSNTFGPRQTGRHSTDDIYKCILNENESKFVHNLTDGSS